MTLVIHNTAYASQCKEVYNGSADNGVTKTLIQLASNYLNKASDDNPVNKIFGYEKVLEDLARSIGIERPLVRHWMSNDTIKMQFSQPYRDIVFTVKLRWDSKDDFMDSNYVVENFQISVYDKHSEFDFLIKRYNSLLPISIMNRVQWSTHDVTHRPISPKLGFNQIMTDPRHIETILPSDLTLEELKIILGNLGQTKPRSE